MSLHIELIPDNSRGEFLVRHFKNPLFDLIVFQVADNIYKDYSGLFWVYAAAVYTPEDEERHLGYAPFMYPDVKDNITLVNPFSGEPCEVEPVLGGMVLSLYALNLALERSPQEHLGELYYTLRDALLMRCSELQRMDVWSALID